MSLVSTSKFLSLVLRHDPGVIGIALDANGWVDVDELLAACERAGKRVSRELLEEIVSTSDKKRFSFSEDGRRIRANQGHSVNVDLGLRPMEPPDVLYHGTAERNLGSILRQGLVKGKRHHVHLSADTDTAKAVGRRHGTPVVLSIDAAAMVEDGFSFYRSENGVWLVDEVPAKYISRS